MHSQCPPCSYAYDPTFVYVCVGAHPHKLVCMCVNHFPWQIRQPVPSGLPRGLRDRNPALADIENKLARKELF